MTWITYQHTGDPWPQRALCYITNESFAPLHKLFTRDLFHSLFACSFAGFVNLHTRYENRWFKLWFSPLWAFFFISTFLLSHSICDFIHCKCCTESSYYICASHSAYKKSLLESFDTSVVDYNTNSIYSTFKSVIAKVLNWKNNVKHDENNRHYSLSHLTFLLLAFLTLELWVSMLYKLNV